MLLIWQCSETGISVKVADIFFDKESLYINQVREAELSDDHAIECDHRSVLVVVDFIVYRSILKILCHEVFIEASLDVTISICFLIYSSSKRDLSCTLTLLEVSLEIKDQMRLLFGQLESASKLTGLAILPMLDRELAGPRHGLNSQPLLSLQELLDVNLPHSIVLTN